MARAKEVQQYPSYSRHPNGCQLLFKAKRTTQEQRFVQSLLEQSALIARTYESVRRFRQILTERDETTLHPWACEAEASEIPELKRFGKPIASGLGSGGKCVTVCQQSRTGRRSSESAEGRAPRQGYGRAGPALLQARLVGASNLYGKGA